MGYEEIGVCLICSKEFVKTRLDRKYCSRSCAFIAANRAARARNRGEITENGTDCPYNKSVVCTNRKCDSCGWNPVVAKRRSASHGK